MPDDAKAITANVAELKRELTAVYKKYGVFQPDTAGQIMTHVNSGGVSKLEWMKLEIK